jgi:hypothetical protein
VQVGVGKAVNHGSTESYASLARSLIGYCTPIDKLLHVEHAANLVKTRLLCMQVAEERLTT